MADAGNIDLLRSEEDESTWLCDGSVLVRVTGSPAVAGLDEGEYKIVMGRGLIRNQDKDGGDRGPKVNLPRLFTRVRRFHYCPAYATVFSITHTQAMIMFAEVAQVFHHGKRKPKATRYALAMNEKVWLAFKAAYPDAVLSHPGYDGPFKISTPAIPELAYVETIRIPQKRQPAAHALVAACGYHEESTEDDDGTE